MQAIVPEEALPPAANGYKPSHPDLFRVKFVTGSYASSLIAIKVRPSRSSGVVRLKGAGTSFQAFKRDEILSFLDHATLTTTRLYSTVQWGPRQEDNLELNSDLLYGKSTLAVSRRCEWSLT